MTFDIVGITMNYFNLLLIACAVLLAATLLNRKQKSESKSTKNTADEKDENQFPDLNEKILTDCEGRETVDLVKVFSSQDRDILRSILDSEGIHTYVKSNHFGELYPTFDIHNFATTVITIYEEDSNSAKEIVKDYILTLQKESYEDSNALDNAIKTGAVLSGVPPQLSNFLPELLI